MKAKIKALIKQVQSGKLKNDKQRIINYGLRKDFTIKDIQYFLFMNLETVVARVSGLQDLGILAVKKNVEQHGSTYSLFYVELDEEKQTENRKQRLTEKYKRWLKRIDLFDDFNVLEDVIKGLNNAKSKNKS